VASTQDGDSGSTMEVYIGLQNSTGDPIYSSKPAELSLTFVDASENELFSDNWDLTNSHLSSWTKTASGQKFKGFLIEIPMDSIDRSFTGSYGTLAIYLDYGSWYFEYDIDVSNLPEATDAEQEAFSFEQFMENSVPLSRVKTRSRDWRVTPLNAGCFTKMGNYGSIETGVRVDIELENTDNTINTFYDDSLLVIPGGATVDRAYDSTAVGADLIPGTTFNGYLFFEDLDCTAGTYRFVMSNWNGMYIDEEFTLGN
jgi:hypothetical protein